MDWLLIVWIYKEKKEKGNMSKYMLLGGGGVFAVHTAKYLLDLPDTQKIIAVGRNIARGSAYTLDVGKDDPRYSYEQVHITFEQDMLFELIDRERPDYIINYAAIAYATSWEKSYRYYDTNMLAVVKMCEELSKRSFLKKFIQISTSELYGSVDRPVDEHCLLNPGSPYAVSKLAADLHLLTLHHTGKLPMNIIRPSNAYGPGQQIWRIIPKAIYCGLTQQKLPLEGGGIARKSYLHARDLARVIYLIVKNAPLGEIYNVGPKTPDTIKNVVMMVARELNIEFDELCEMVPGRLYEDTQYWLDSSKIERELGWTQEIGLKEGIADMVNWGKQYLQLLHSESQEFMLHA